MDIPELVKATKARFNHNVNKTYLKDKYTAKLSVANQGGLWKASPELIGFLAHNTDPVLILLDSYENPVMVNRVELHDVLHKTYSDTMILWYNELKELEKNR